MDDLEQKLASVMNDPAMMQQIMTLAQSFQAESAPAPEQAAAAPEMPDTAMLKQLAGFAKQSGIDKDQKALLQALQPYLKDNRIQRLERAMRAAKMAGFATSLLGR